MFGLFRKRPKANAKLEGALDISHNLLMTQVAMGGALESGDAQNRLVGHYPFGYVFGFTDAMIQAAGVTDDVQAMANLTIAFTSLFGTDKGSRILGKCFDSQADPVFMAGRKLGGQEAMRWLSARDTFTPMGLVDYLRSGKLPQA